MRISGIVEDLSSGTFSAIADMFSVIASSAEAERSNPSAGASWIASVAPLLRNDENVLRWNAQWRKSFQLKRAMTKTFSAEMRTGATVFSWNAQWRKSFQLKRAMTKTFSAGTRNGAKIFS